MVFMEGKSTLHTHRKGMVLTDSADLAMWNVGDRSLQYTVTKSSQPLS
jgi:hypothetical protein